MSKPVRVPLPVERAYITIATAIVAAVVSWAIYASIAERVHPEVIALAVAIISSVSAIVLTGLWIIRRANVADHNAILAAVDANEERRARARDWHDYAQELAEQTRAAESTNVTYLHPNGHRN